MSECPDPLLGMGATRRVGPPEPSREPVTPTAGPVVDADRPDPREESLSIPPVARQIALAAVSLGSAGGRRGTGSPGGPRDPASRSAGWRWARNRWVVRAITVSFSSAFSWLLALLLAPRFAPTAAVIGALCSAATAVLVDRLVAGYRDIIRKQNGRLADQVAELERVNGLLVDSNAELRAFAHTVAHDLKSPITALLLEAEMLSQVLDAPSPNASEARRGAAELAAAGRTMAAIVDDLLLLASVSQEEVELRPLDMTSILQRAVARLRAEIEASGARLSLPTELPSAVGYPPWIEQVWVNYLSNAIKYGGDGQGAAIIEVGALRREGWVDFWVRDHGTGIAANDRHRLFQEFTRLDAGRCDGHGLGLWIVRRIVERLGGTVGVDSRVGEGSTFSFRLPVARGLTADEGTGLASGRPGSRQDAPHVAAERAGRRVA
ncbi:MAG: sensor histidine kinase [Acidobacteria bacterium]|nr:MAG: sensor histidine kinase [Acidobacteriota bacterium]